MVVLTTSKTTTTWVLAVLSYTTVTGGDVTTVLAGLREAGRHGVCRMKERISKIVYTNATSKRHPKPPERIQPRNQYFWVEKLGGCGLSVFWSGEDQRFGEKGEDTDLEGG